MEISEVTRRDILDFLLLRKKPFHGRLDLISFLKRIWDLSSMPSTDSRFKDAEGDIWQHMVNNYDWEYDYLLFNYLNLLKCPDNEFIKFIENTLHPLVLNDDEILSSTLSEYTKRLAADGFLLEITDYISDKPIYLVVKKDKKHMILPKDVYEVVLSFAGEDRDYVEKVADYLKKHDVKLFYDKFEKVTLWGKDLAEHLDKVYRGSARYCIIFISKHYADKVWPNHERKSALARAIEEKEEYILPARFDNTELPGIRPTIGYIDLNGLRPDDFGGLIMEKLGRL